MVFLDSSKMSLRCLFWCLLSRSVIYSFFPRYRNAHGFFPIASSKKLSASDVIRPCSTFRQGRSKWYVLQEGQRHFIPDRFTKDSLFCDDRQRINKTSIDSSVVGNDIQSLWDSHPNTALLSLLQNGTGLVTKTYRHLNHITNPSMIFTDGDAFLSGRAMNDAKYVKIWWIQNVSSNNASIFQEGNRIFHDDNMNNGLIPVSKILGEDPRLFILSNGRIFITFCHRFPKKIPELQMAYSEIIARNNSIQVGPMIDIKFDELVTQDQKNWCPFEYNGTMLFVANILPHRIVGLSSDYEWEGEGEGEGGGRPEGHMYDPSLPVPPGESSRASKTPSRVTGASTVSLTSMNGFTWGYGDMRGGTPAVCLNDSMNLSFFHSSNDIAANGTQLKTYVIGAYLFDSTPPFAIKAISTHPLVHESMYTGTWTDLRQSYYHIDYVVFPMSFTIDQGTVILMYGKQDTSAWIATMNLTSLLNSLAPVQSTEISNAYSHP